MPPVGFELTISAAERPQIYALGRAANISVDGIFKSGKYLEMFRRNLLPE